MSGCMRAAKTVQREKGARSTKEQKPSKYGLGAVDATPPQHRPPPAYSAQVHADGSDLAAQPGLLTEDTIHCIHGEDFDKVG